MGTSIIGKAFGPIMFVWFTFLGVIGLINMSGDWSILQAINPVYAIKLLFSPYNKAGIFILGSIFLATTGAEALYSDVGHVGKKNIIGSWPFVFVCLSLNYFGQGVWILNNPTYRPADGGVPVSYTHLLSYHTCTNLLINNGLDLCIICFKKSKNIWSLLLGG